MNQHVVAKYHDRLKRQGQKVLTNELPRALHAYWPSARFAVKSTLTRKLCENCRNISGATRRLVEKDGMRESKEGGYKPDGSTVREVDRPIMWRRKIRITARAYKTRIMRSGVPDPYNKQIAEC